MGLRDGTRVELNYGQCQKQRANNCGVHAIAMAVCFAHRNEVSDGRFSHDLMRGHLEGCYERQQLSQFPAPMDKERISVTGKDSRVEIRIPKLWHKLVDVSSPLPKKRRY